MNRREWLQTQREVQRQLGARAYAIYRQPWRIWRNRRLRAEVRAIMAEADRQDEQYRQRRRPR